MLYFIVRTIRDRNKIKKKKKKYTKKIVKIIGII